VAADGRDPGGVAPADGRDPGGMADAIASLPDQIERGWKSALRALEDAGWRGPVDVSTEPRRAGSVDPHAAAPIAGAVACGMGGSAIGADVVRAALPGLPIPFESVRGFDLPSWVGPRSLVIATSYSGNTAETLACMEAAAERGCRPVCVAGGGRLAALARERGWPLVPVSNSLQPRAAVGHLLSAVAAVLQAAGLGADLAAQMSEAVKVLREQAAALSPDGAEAGREARFIAADLHGHATVIYGAGVTTPAARRWKTQINENAKAPAYFAEAPELLHNEVCGWGGAPPAAATTGVVVLTDPLGDERLLRRLELVAKRLDGRAATVVRVAARGSAPLSRCLSALWLGDWVSYYMALQGGVDPTPVADIEQLKQALGRVEP